MLTEPYYDALKEYYNRSRLPSQPGSAMKVEQDRLNNPRSWVHHVVREMQVVLEGKKLLEVACGTGRWTLRASATAKHIRATDVSPNLLENARGLDLPREKVEFVECDAFDLAKVAGTYEAGLHMNFINHLPLDDVPRFLEGFHRVLGTGAVVFCGTQRFKGDRENPRYERKATRDMVSLRKHADGREIEVIDTDFSEDLLRGLLAGKATDLTMTFGKWWWWAHYTVRGARVR